MKSYSVCIFGVAISSCSFPPGSSFAARPRGVDERRELVERRVSHPRLHERIAHMQRELEQTRVKIPKKIATS